MPDPNPAPQAAANPADLNANPAADPAAPAADPAPAAAAPATDSTPKAWGETWRQELAGTDDKAIKQLERFASPKALWESYQAAYQKIRSGELKAPLPDNATAEQLAAFRQERGIPEKPEGYLEKLPDGLVIGEIDKPIFESFVKELHAVNADPKVAHAAVAWYNKFQEEQAAKTAESDAGHRTETEDALRAEWGADYRANVNHLKAFLESAPEGIADQIANARDSEGRALLNSPAVTRWLVQMAREINPSHTIVPGTGGNQAATIETEILSIQKLMGNQNSEYWKGPGAEKMQARYRDLLDAQERLKARAA